MTARAAARRGGPILAPIHPDPEALEATTIARAKAGDADARAWLVRQWTPILHRFATRLLGDEHDARDAAQDTMIKVLRHLDRFDERRSFRTWVFSIARNTCVDALRGRTRRAWDEEREVAHPGPSPLHEVARAQEAERVRTALAAIPPMYREVLVLYHYEHLSCADIAETLDLPLGTVLNRMFRARAKLKTALGEEP